MKNIKFIVLAVLASLGLNIVAQTTKTYTFDDGVALETDWTVVLTGDGLTCKIANNIGGSLTTKEGNYLGFAFTKSNTTIAVTTKAEYTNITSIGIDLSANDNSKPSYSGYIVDGNGNVLETLFENIDSKNSFATGGAKKWGHKEIAVSSKTGYFRLSATTGSSGKYVAIDNITITYTAGSTTPDDPTPDDPTPDDPDPVDPDPTDPDPVTPTPSTGETYAFWRFSGTDAPANGSSESGTKMTVEFINGKEGDTKTFGVESLKYNTAVTDENMMSQGTKGIKSGSNNTYIKVTVDGGFKANDVVYICGYNAWKVSSTAANDGDVAASVTTGTGKEDYNIGSFTLTADYDALYLLRAEGTGTCICAIKVERAGGTTPDDPTPDDPTPDDPTPDDPTPDDPTPDDPTPDDPTPDDPTPVPQTSLTLHQPEKYAAEVIDGGYGGTLSVVNGREYEVYYAGRWDNGGTKLTIHTNPIDKSHGVTANESNTAYEAIDGWFKGSGADKGTGFAAKEEFNKASERCHNLKSSNSIEMHIKGFDQFSLYGMDKKVEPSKPQNNKVFKVLIDDIEQDMTLSTSATIRRFNISTGEHVIRIECGDDCLFGGFSLRAAQEPRVKWLDGNDSTQSVWAGKDLSPIYYYTKYNQLGETRLLWNGAEATGITLSRTNSDAIGDTLVLSGTANCPAGTYAYLVESFSAAGTKTVSLSGKFTVKTQIRYNNPLDTLMEVYQGEEMNPITLSYYAYDESELTLEWQGETPLGITTSAGNGRFTIKGTPTDIGTYPYMISVAGGNTVEGKLVVLELNLGENPVLYLQKERDAYKQDGIYAYLQNRGYNLIARVTQDGLRKPEQYAMYKWILISEDVDADNGEVLAVTREGANRPVLNMKSFSYAPNRLDWGQPNNGSISDEGRFITVQSADHPIFQTLHKKKGDKIQVLETVNKKGLMPVAVHLNNTLCLATALTRSADDYYGDGKEETFLHEIPASMRGGQKYICMPIAMSSSNLLTTDGKKLLEAVVNYLQSDEPTILPPTLQITSFTVGDFVGEIDDENNTITFDINRHDLEGIDLSNIVPTITLADPENTHLIPDPNEPVDLEWTKYIPVTFTVTDYVSQRTYTIIVNLYSPEGIDEVYSVGEWVNIFDIYGRKITTTNEDIYSMTLPHGVYLVVTENGKTLKIMK